MYWLNLLYALICLVMAVCGISLLVHLRGVREHAPDCVFCIVVHRLFRVPR